MAKQASGAKNVEDVYRLSALQETLLVHHLRAAPGGAGPAVDSGVVVLRATLEGRFDDDRFRDAWRAAVARHPALRTSVHWRNLKHPVQVVAAEVEAALEVVDWRGEGEAKREERVAAFVEEERRRGLDLSRAPVGRLTVLRLAEERSLLVWSCHHLLLDGWSSALVLREILAGDAAAAAGKSGAEPPAPRPYRDYVAWSRSRRDAADFWSRTGLEPRRLLETPLLVGRGWSGGARVDSRLERVLAGGGGGSEIGLGLAEIEAWARRHRVTAGSLLLAAWGLVLTEATGGERAVLGFTTSGRAAELEGLESMVGLFAGVLPMAVEIAPDNPPAELVAAVFARQQAAQAFESWPLDRLFEARGVALRRAPFDTLLAFANFPVVAAAAAAVDDSDNSGSDSSDDTGLSMTDLRGDVTSASPLTVAVVPGAVEGQLRLAASFDSALLPRAAVAALLERFGAVLGMIVGGRATAVGELLGEPTAALRALRRSAGPAPAARPLGGTGAAAPETATEAQLMRIWNDLVAVQEYTVDDNFFELGGHSLLVPQMLLRIEQDFGVSLPLGTVFENATVRALAVAVDRAESRHAWRPLVPVRRLGALKPLFLVHGLGGEVGWFYNLANHLDPEMPLFGLQAPSEPLEKLEDMARLYLEEVRREQPSGPYRLGGYCIGGGVAYEMARQLEAAGERASTLVLIDSVPQAHIAGSGVASPAGFAQRLGRLLSKEPREIVRSTRDFARRASRRLAGGDAGRSPELDDVLDMETLPRVYHEASRRHFRAMRDYRPGPYGGDAWLLRTGDDRFAEDFGWGELVRGELVVERIPGRHADVLKEPHVAEVGRKLAAALDARA